MGVGGGIGKNQRNEYDWKYSKERKQGYKRENEKKGFFNKLVF